MQSLWIRWSLISRLHVKIMDLTAATDSLKNLRAKYHTSLSIEHIVNQKSNLILCQLKMREVTDFQTKWFDNDGGNSQKIIKSWKLDE